MDNKEMLRKIAVDMMGAKTEQEIDIFVKMFIRMFIG